MARKKPLSLPEGVTVVFERGDDLSTLARVTGPRGELTVGLPKGIKAKVRDQSVSFQRETGVPDSIFGLARALLRNAVEGVSQGFVRELELVGVGYRAEKTTDGLKLSLGFSHPVEFKVPQGVSVEVEGNTKIRLSGIDKQLVSQTAAEIRDLKPPEPYKGKGIRYVGEVVRRKLGKAAKAAVGSPGMGG